MMQVKQECLAEAAAAGGGAEPHDEFDDLTVEELKSLLDNFKNLAKAEQMDLIQVLIWSRSEFFNHDTMIWSSY